MITGINRARFDFSRESLDDVRAAKSIWRANWHTSSKTRTTGRDATNLGRKTNRLRISPRGRMAEVVRMKRK